MWLFSVPFAHRGLHDADFPENSIPAFDAAASAGYGIELDVHCTADDRLIVMHDDTTLRMTGEDLRITEVQSEELIDLSLVDTQYKIPLLDEVLTRVASRVPVLIEVKPDSPMHRTGPALLRSLDGYSGEVAVQSFDPRVIMWMKRNAPDIVRGQLSSDFSNERIPVIQKLLLRSMLTNLLTRPQFIAFNIDAMPSISVFLWRLILRVPFLLWTVRTTEQLHRAGKYHGNIIFEKVRPALTAAPRS